MDDELLGALRLLLAKGDDGELFDREAPEGGYTSEELEKALAIIRSAVEGADKADG